MIGVIHYNPALPHQVDHAKAFQACGFDITPCPDGDADIHVISGPWFAYRKWLGHPRVLMIDRAWWDDPNSVSIGWLQPDGTRKFAKGDAPRRHPVMRPWKTREDSCLLMADYGQDVSDIELEAVSRFTTVQVRRHPAESSPHQVGLSAALGLRDVAIGHSGTGVFEAIRLGVPTICTDPNNECMPVCVPSVQDELYRGDRNMWMHEMAYKQFTLEEIADGTAWSLLKDVE